MLTFADLVNCVKGYTTSNYNMYYGAASSFSQLAQLCQKLQQVSNSVIDTSLGNAEQTGGYTIGTAASPA